MCEIEEVVESPEKKPNKIVAELIDWLKSIVGAAIIVGLIFGFVISSVRVDGSSMEPTLHHEDRLIAYKLFYTPKVGDVVILDKNSGLGTPLVKRVIATEGQTVELTEDGFVLVDGEIITENYILESHTKGSMGNLEYPVTVPEDCVFVMGDNRNHSTDSRFKVVGFVKEDNVMGKVVLRLFPFSKMGIVK